MSDEVDRYIVRAYRAGLKKAISDYAVWKDGGQFVGVMRKPLKEVLAEVDAMPEQEALQAALRGME